VCVCILRYQAWNVHAPYCHQRFVWLYCIFAHYHINGTVFREKKLQNMKCAIWFSVQLLSKSFLILRRTKRDMIRYVFWSSCKVPVNLVRFKWNLNSLDRFSKNNEISNFMKICPVGAELFYMDRQMGRHDEANSCVSQFCSYAWNV
jgi:hypothetical protein